MNVIFLYWEVCMWVKEIDLAEIHMSSLLVKKNVLKCTSLLGDLMNASGKCRNLFQAWIDIT